MKLLSLFLSLVLALAAGAANALGAGSLGWHADALALQLNQDEKLPPLPAGVSELRFNQMFRTPVGPRGLEFNEELQALDGKRVRVLGYMVRQTRPSPGVAMLAPFNFSTNESEYSLADDIPPTVVFVEVPRFADIAVPYTRGPLLLTGRLELGRREEKDGRISLVRLILDSE